MASAWKKVEPVDSCNLQEIMSEEYARGLQDQENKKYENHLNDIAGPCIDAQIASQFVNDSVETVADATKMTKDTTIGRQNQLSDIPEDVLNFIKNDSELSQSVDFCDSDRILAEMLQATFDKEHDDEVNRIEKHTNKDSKISVSFSNFRRQHPGTTTSDSDDYDDGDEQPKNWDRFEANEKIYRGLNKKGFGHDEDGVIITKHDAQMCGVRNACRVMSFPPEFTTGDAAGFDMKLSNQVFNQLKSYSQKNKKTNKAQDRRETKATAEMGIDEPTRLRLYKWINNQVLEQVNGIISTGKEAIILHANTDPAYSGDLVLPKECAIKIFKTTLNEFKQRDRYIKDDYRFKDRFSKQNNRTVIFMWAEKEMHNLMRIQKIGINCPEVVAFKKNILLMSFIGSNGVAAPKLKNAILSDAELITAYEEVVDIMVRLYNNGNLVHADLSEYNILWHDNKCWLIDVAQSVEPGHPSAWEFLMRDCDNISTFFKRKGVSGVKTKEELFSHITGLDPSVHNAAMLERLHAKGPTETMATAQDMDEVPDQVKPISYPFDYAWNKTQEQKFFASDIDSSFAAN